MGNKHVVLLLIPTGKRKELVKYFGGRLCNVHNIEATLLKELGTEHMHEAITQNNRRGVHQAWDKAVEKIVNQIDYSADETHAIIGHTVYYNSNTHEFFPVFDAGFLKRRLDEKKIMITRTVLIIDDVFDSFANLRKDGKLYAEAGLFYFFNDYSRVAKKDFSDIANDPKAHLSWIHYCVNSILKWRSHEIASAESISKQVGSPLLLWGMKQDFNVLISWLQETTKKIFYISHPISEPRRIHNKRKKWPPLVDVLNSIQSESLKQGLLTLMPTAIDEYRFDKTKDHHYSTKLTPRWPIPKHVEKMLREFDIIESNPDHIDILRPRKIIKGEALLRETKKLSGVKHVSNFVDGILTTLEVSIHEEIGNRDHHLVWLTNGIIVIDPYSVEEDKIHGGVKKELQYLRAVNEGIRKQYSSNTTQINLESRKLCAIFERSTLRKLVKKPVFRTEYVNKLEDLVRQEYLSLDQISKLFDTKGKLIANSSTLGPDISAPNLTSLQPKLPNFRERALILELVTRTLQMTEDNLGHVMIILVDDLKELSKSSVIRKIHDFLMLDKVDDKWRKEFLCMAADGGIKVSP